VSERLLRLAQRIRDECEELARLVARAQEAWRRLQQSSDDLYADSVARWADIGGTHVHQTCHPFAFWVSGSTGSIIETEDAPGYKRPATSCETLLEKGAIADV
jgi:hypothetical protein